MRIIFLVLNLYVCTIIYLHFPSNAKYHALQRISSFETQCEVKFECFRSESDLFNDKIIGNKVYI